MRVAPVARGIVGILVQHIYPSFQIHPFGFSMEISQSVSPLVAGKIAHFEGIGLLGSEPLHGQERQQNY